MIIKIRSDILVSFGLLLLHDNLSRFRDKERERLPKLNTMLAHHISDIIAALYMRSLDTFCVCKCVFEIICYFSLSQSYNLSD